MLTRVHSECLTGDVFGSNRCDCGPQLDEALERIVSEGRGVVVYLRGHEGRGIGLVAKLQAYQLQDGGRDTVDANLDLGLPADARHYGTATQILRDLKVESVRLLTNNPDKVHNLEDFGIPVAERVPLTPHPNDHNLAYLRTKRDRMGHHLPDLHRERRHCDERSRSTRPEARRLPRPAGRHRRGQLARDRSWTASSTAPSAPARTTGSRRRCWSACPAPSSCPSWRPPSPARGTTPWSPSAW